MADTSMIIGLLGAVAVISCCCCGQSALAGWIYWEKDKNTDDEDGAVVV